METDKSEELGKPGQEIGTPDFLTSQQSPSQVLLERLKALKKYQEKQREELQHQVQSRRSVAPTFPSHSQIIKKLAINPEIQLAQESPHSYPDKLCNKAQKVPHADSGVSQPKPCILEKHRENHKEKEEYESEYTRNFSSHDPSDLRKATQSEKLTATLPSRMINSEFLVTSVANQDSLGHPAHQDHHSNISNEHHELVEVRIPNEFRAGDGLYDDAVMQSFTSSTELQACTPPQSDDIYYSASDFEQIRIEKVDWEQGYQSDKYKSSSEIKADILSNGKGESCFALKSNNATCGSHFTVTGRGFGKNISVGVEPNDAPKVKRKFLRKGEGTSRFGMKPIRLKKPKATEQIPTDKLGSPVKQQIMGNINGLESPNVSNTKLLTTKCVKFIPRQPVKNLEIKSVPSKLSCTSGHEIDSNSNYGSKSQESGILKCTPKSPIKPSILKVNFDKQNLKDQEELLAFEKLEELADDSSFSSNSSTVLQLLLHGQHSAASTPLRSPAPFSPQGTPILNQRNEQQCLFENSGHESQNVDAVSLNTPSVQEVLPQSRPHVHFNSEVVSKEYEVLETDDDDTLTNTSSIANDDSVLLTSSDFEELALLHMLRSSQGLPQASVLNNDKQHRECLSEDVGEEADSEDDSLSDTLTPEVPRKGKGLHPVALQFSPPPHRSENTASDYIESIFGKNKNTKQKPRKKIMPDEAEKDIKQPYKPSQDNVENVAARPKQQEEHSDDEIETYKTLLLAKISELEKETKIFKRENLKLQNLLQATQEEKQQVENERQKLQEETTRERKRFEEYVDRERNAIWKEKQQLRHHQSPTISDAKEHSLEIVYLKEQILDLREESKKKESLAQFNVRKLNEKVRALEEENKQLRKTNLSLQNLEKTNLQLKHELDRVKLSRKAVSASQPENTRGKQRSNVKAATVSSVNRSLDQMKRNDGKRTVDSLGTKYHPSLNKNKHSDGDPDPESHSTNVASLFNDEEKVPRSQGITLFSHSVEQNSVPENSLDVNDGLVGGLQKVTLVDQDDTEVADTQKQGGSADINNQNAHLPSEEMNLESYEVVREDGTREITYANGNKKEIYPNGVIIVSYFNNDRKEIYEDRTVYIYGTDKTSHTTFNDGKEVYIFPSGQKETRYLDGSSEIVFADNSQKITFKDGTEVCKTKDGTVVRTNPDGSKVFEFTSGQREIHQDGEKRREYPDGTVKILHQDGRTETRYKSGRIRMKDSEGNIVLDTHGGVS